MSIIQALLLGLVQGLTEFIPVSSSGHLVIFPSLFGWQEHSITFDIIVHLATLLAVLVFFRKKLYKTFIDIFSKDKDSRQESFSLIRNLFLGTVPVLIFYLIFGDLIENQFKSLYVITVTLLILGILLIKSDLVFKKNPTTSINKLTTKQSLIIGIFQSLSLIRGTSRSGISILAGGFMGLDKKEATEFAFLLSIPAIGSSLGKIFLDIDQINFSAEAGALIVGFIAAFISGLLAINFLIKYLKTKDLAVFGYYRIILAIFLFIFLLN